MKDFQPKIRPNINRRELYLYADRHIYGKFKAKCKKLDLKIMNVFEDFMFWFVEEYKDDR